MNGIIYIENQEGSAPKARGFDSKAEYILWLRHHANNAGFVASDDCEDIECAMRKAIDPSGRDVVLTQDEFMDLIECDDLRLNGSFELYCVMLEMAVTMGWTK